jgi:transcriptional regulator with XRE-family HTH domain
MRWQTEGMAKVTVNSIGEYIREQREQAKISMRQLAQTAGVSNPYLSQIERGLRRPSADILQQIAKGLRISAEALYVQAGILDDRPADTGVRSALLTDAELSERQKQVLIEIYESFRRENAAAAEAAAVTPVPLAAGESDAAEQDALDQDALDQDALDQDALDQDALDQDEAESGTGDLDGGAPGAEAFTAEAIAEAFAEASAGGAQAPGIQSDSSQSDSSQHDSGRPGDSPQTVPTIRPDSASD